MVLKGALAGIAVLYAASSGSFGCQDPDTQQQIGIHRQQQSPITQVTRENFDEVVLRSSRPVVVDFYADWCLHCQNIERPYRGAARAMSSRMTFTKYDAESDRAIPQRYQVREFPTFIVFDDGNEVCRIAGSRQDIQRDLESCLENQQKYLRFAY